MHAIQQKTQRFLAQESAAGILLILATLLALLCSNSFVAPVYQNLLHLPVELRVGQLHLDKTLYHWVNDGLMAIFFLLVGLEVKREILQGHLSSLSQVALPGFAALGGMLVPAAIYILFNQTNPRALAGWAIPTATDIAFALGVLSLLGRRVPASLKIFLMALAIIDDLGAILIIALFYTSGLSLLSLGVALAAMLLLVLLNRAGVANKIPYLLLGIVLWTSVLKSGVHATLAGVALAFTIPLTIRDRNGGEESPLRELEHLLHPWVAFLILPLFAFVNAGVALRGISISQMAGAVPMGIMGGLFIGKQLGVFGFSWLAIKLRLAKLPAQCNWRQLYGVSLLTGIGFTMSLFIVSLAFVDDTLFLYTDKLAILLGSLLSGTAGYLLLRLDSGHAEATAQPTGPATPALVSPPRRSRSAAPHAPHSSSVD
jgi:NhaA family Na+:H+ antiporter